MPELLLARSIAHRRRRHVALSFEGHLRVLLLIQVELGFEHFDLLPLEVEQLLLPCHLLLRVEI
jgi:hypothetical protein